MRVNGVNGQWIFDTGANISTLTETEAKRIGLSVRETSAYVNGSTEKRNALQLAVASDVQLGAAHIHNVVFLVLADRALYIGPLHYQIAGILGLPVLRALRRVEISSAGLLRVHSRETIPQGTPNLFFDEASPIVEIDRDQHRLQMFLDTGANASVLYPSFLDALGHDESLRLRTKREKLAGAGGVIQRKTQVVPTLGIEILGKPISLRKVSLLSGRRRATAVTATESSEWMPCGAASGWTSMQCGWRSNRRPFDILKSQSSGTMQRPPAIAVGLAA